MTIKDIMIYAFSILALVFAVIGLAETKQHLGRQQALNAGIEVLEVECGMDAKVAKHEILRRLERMDQR